LRILIAGAPRTFKDVFVAGVIFSLSVASKPQHAQALGRAFHPLDGARPPSHGAAMTMIRNRFFGICREIICA
jgi:hypothetical protein